MESVHESRRGVEWECVESVHESRRGVCGWSGSVWRVCMRVGVWCDGEVPILSRVSLSIILKN